MNGTLFDGLSAQAHAVTLSYTPDGIAITAADGSAALVPVKQLRRSDPRGPRLVLHRTDLPDWRLVPEAPPPADWLACIVPIGRFGSAGIARYAGATVLSATVAAGLWLFGDRLLVSAAPLVPEKLLVSLGDGLVHELGGRRCVAPAGVAALDRLAARLQPPRETPRNRRILVIATPAVNALAAPGSRIVIFSGLIDKAASADEVAGVLAHEITHDRLRHPTKALLRQFGVSLLASAIGGNLGSVADTTIMLRSTRSAEADADRGAIALLQKAQVSPRGLGDLFVRLRDEDRRTPRDRMGALLDTIGDFANTHPADTERASVMAAAVRQQGRVTPALSHDDWQALRAICAQTATN
jgi:Zn-dependent protease with chaperone function